MEPEYTPEQREYLDKLPYMQLICKRIDDIDNAINRGESGVSQVENLLTDLPQEWLKDLPQIRKQKVVEIQHDKTNPYTNKSTPKQVAYNEIQLSRFLKSYVVGILNDKRMLFSTRPTAPELSYSLYEEEKHNEQ